MLNRIYDWAKSIRQKLSEKGQGMVEYAVILAAVAIIAAVVLWQNDGLQDSVQGAFDKAASDVKAAQKNTTATTPPANTEGEQH